MIHDNAGENLIFEAHYSPPSFDIASSSPFGRNRRILTAQTLEDAVKGADTYAKKNVGSGTFCLGLVNSTLISTQADTGVQGFFAQQNGGRRLPLNLRKRS